MKLMNDIPVPDTIVLPGRPPAYPFRTMELGACFKVRADELKKVRMAVLRQNKNGGPRRFLVGIQEGRWYCWRVK